MMMRKWRESHNGISYVMYGDLDFCREFVKSANQFYDSMALINKDMKVWAKERTFSVGDLPVTIHIQNVNGVPQIRIFAARGEEKEHLHKWRIPPRKIWLESFLPYIVVYDEVEFHGPDPEDAVETPIGFLVCLNGTFDGPYMPLYQFDDERLEPVMLGLYNAEGTHSSAITLHYDLLHHGIGTRAVQMEMEETGSTNFIDNYYYGGGGSHCEQNVTTWLQAPDGYQENPPGSAAILSSTAHFRGRAWTIPFLGGAHNGVWGASTIAGQAYLVTDYQNCFYANDFNYYGVVYTLSNISESIGAFQYVYGNELCEWPIDEPPGYETDYCPPWNPELWEEGPRLPMSDLHLSPDMQWSVGNTGTTFVMVNGIEYPIYSGRHGCFNPDRGGRSVSPQMLRPPASQFSPWSSNRYYWGEPWMGIGALTLPSSFIEETRMKYGQSYDVYGENGWETVYDTTCRDLEEYPLHLSSSGQDETGSTSCKYWYIDEHRQIFMYVMCVVIGKEYNNMWCYDPTGVREFSEQQFGPHTVAALGGNSDGGVFDEVNYLWATQQRLYWGIVYAGDGWPSELRGHHVHEVEVPANQDPLYARYNTGVEMRDGKTAWASFNVGLCRRVIFLDIEEQEFEYKTRY